MGGGGSARRRLAGASDLGDARGYGLRELAQREQGIKACSPKPGSEQRRRAEASTSELGGGDGVVVADGVDAGVLQAPGIHGKLRGVPAMSPRGSAGTERQRRHGIAAAVGLTGGAAQEEFPCCRASESRARTRRASGRRCGAKAGVCGCRGEVGRSALGGAGDLARRSGWWRRVRVRDGGAGVRGVLI